MRSERSLRQRSRDAALWAGGAHALGQVMRLAGNVVLARLLMPEAFGLMAVILTLLTALNLLSDIGTGTVIVQSRRGEEEDFLNTAWTLQIIRGFAIWLLGVLLAVGIAGGQAVGAFAPGTVYDDARLPMLLGAAAFMMAILGLASVNARLAQRNLQLKAVSVIDLCAQALALGVMIVAAYFTRSVWALVAGSLVGALLQAVLTHAFLAGPRSRLRLEREAVRELVRKGKWVLVASLLGFIANNGDRLLLGGMIDGTLLGLYSIALGLASVAPAALSAVLAKVVFPAFSEVVRDRPQDLPAVYRRFQQRTDAVLGLLAGFLFATSGPIVALLYDERYLGAAPIFAALAAGSLGVRFYIVEQIYVAMGKTSLLAAAIVPRAIVMLVGVPLGYAAGGLSGALAGIVLSQFAHWPLAIWFRSAYKLGQLSNDLLLPVGIAGGLALGWVCVELVRRLPA